MPRCRLLSLLCIWQDTIDKLCYKAEKAFHKFPHLVYTNRNKDPITRSRKLTINTKPFRWSL